MLSLNYPGKVRTSYPKSALCVALGIALSWMISAQATVTYNSSLTPDGYDPLTPTDDTTLYKYSQDSGSISGTIFTVSDTNNSVNFQTILTGEVTLTGSTYAVTPGTSETTIGSVTSYLGTSSSSLKLINDGNYVFSAIRLTSNWTSFTATGDVEYDFTNATLDLVANTSASYVFDAVEVNNYTGTDITSLPSASFQNISVSLNNLSIDDDSEGKIWIMGLASGVTNGAYYGTQVTAKDITVKVVNDSENESADFRGVRAVDNEGGEITVSGTTSVTITGGITPRDVRGLYTGLKNQLYATMEGQEYSNTTIGDIYVTVSGTTEQENNTTIWGIQANANPNESNTTNETYAGTTIAGNIYVTVENATETGTVGGYESFDTGATLYGDDSTLASTKVNTTIASITVKVTDVDHGVSGEYGIYGVDKEDAGTLTVNGAIELSSDGTSEPTLLGLYQTAGTSTVNGIISVEASADATNTSSSSNDVGGIYVSGGTITASGVEITVSNFSSPDVQGVYVDNAILTMNGATKVELTDVTVSPFTTSGNISGVMVEDASTVTLNGNVEVDIINSSTFQLFGRNMYGVAVASSATDATFSQDSSYTNTVNLEGTELVQYKSTIYGFVDVNKPDATHGKTTLNFGTGSSATFSSLSSLYLGSFANFDVVNVNSGSTLLLFSGVQADELEGEEEVFGDGVTPTYVLGEDADTSSNSSYINGVVSYDGNLYVSAESSGTNGTPTFNIDSGAVVAVSTIENYGIINNTSSILAAEEFNMNGESEFTDTNALELVSKLNIKGGTFTSTGGDVKAAHLTTTGGTLIVGENASLLVPSTVTWNNTYSPSTELQEAIKKIEEYFPSLSIPDLNVDNYQFSGEAVLTGGTVKVDGSGATAVVSLSSSEASPMSAKVYVGNGGKLGFGETVVKLDTTLPESTAVTTTISTSPLLAAANDFYEGSIDDIPENSLTLTSTVWTGNNGDNEGYIQVGGEFTDPKGLDFESGSTLILPYSMYAETSEDDPVYAFISTDSAAEVKASGASIVMGVTSSGGIPDQWYMLTKNYDYSQGVWDTSDVTVNDEYGRTWLYEVRTDDEYDGTDYVYLYRMKTVPEDDFCQLGYVACNNIQTDTEDPSQPGPGIVNDIVSNYDIPIEDRVKVMNSIANLPFAGGVIGTAMNGLNGAITDIFNHLTMDSDTFGAHGVLWPYDEFNNMWLDVHGTWYNQKHLSASGIDRAGWRANEFGFILGYDRKLKERPVAIGGAFSFTGGNAKSTGNISYTKNKYQEYGLHLWSNYSPNEHLNVIGALHWMHNVSDVNQNIGLQGLSGTYYNKAQGHMTTDWFALGVRFETSLSAGKFTFVPHIEPRYVYAKMRDFDTKIDGTTIWRTHAKGNSFFQIPLGIAARADFLTESGWTIRPNADVTITPQAGSTKLRTQLRNVYNAVDAVEGEFMGKFQTAVKLGVQFDRKNWTLGAKYGLVAGDRGKLDHGFIIQTRLRF